jgi:hypothetical protein
MNEYQSQQGLTAQRLQADLNAIESAAEESLSESYRIRVEPREHEDAERQRRLANAALSSGIAAYETDLGTITRSEMQQVQEILSAVGANGLDVANQREMQFLKQLGESLPGLFNEMADDLTKLMGERGQAQVELSKAHESLKNSMGELESRNREAGTLSEMADLLQSCFTLEEASGVIASSAQKLFHGFSGAVLVFSASRNVLEANTTWGRSSQAERVFSPNDCWALRRGRLHHSGSDEGSARCQHQSLTPRKIQVNRVISR